MLAPKRHGKTLASALIIVWRFLTRRTQTIGIVANSQKQTIDTAFKMIRSILEQTPYSSSLIKAKKIVIQRDNITYSALDNSIQGFSSSTANLYGKKLAIAQVSELHAASDDEAFQTMASATIDTDDGLVLIDSTVGSMNSPLYSLYQIAQNEQDPTLFYSHIYYRDLDDACTNAPKWIKLEALRSRAAQMLPAEFAQQHLNLWQSGSNSLFPSHVLDKCVDSYRIDVDSITGNVLVDQEEIAIKSWIIEKVVTH